MTNGSAPTVELTLARCWRAPRFETIWSPRRDYESAPSIVREAHPGYWGYVVAQISGEVYAHCGGRIVRVGDELSERDATVMALEYRVVVSGMEA